MMKTYLLVFLHFIFALPLVAQKPIDLLKKGEDLWEKREYKASHEIFVMLEKSFVKVRQYDKAAYARLDIGYIFDEQGLKKEAINAWNVGLASYKDMMSNETKFEYYANLGQAYLLLGKEDSALFNLDRAALFLPKINFPRMTQSFYNTYGMWHYYRGDYLQASDYYNVSGKIINSNHFDTEYVAQYANNLGKCYEAMGYLDKALPLFQKAIAISSSSDPEYKYIRLLNLGQCQKLKGQWAAAQNTFGQVQTLLEQLKKGKLSSWVTWEKYYKLYHHQAELQLAQNQIDKAEQLFIKAQQLVLTNPSCGLVPDTYIGLATIATARRQTDKALAYVQTSLMVGNPFFKQKNIAQNPINGFQQFNQICKKPEYFDALKLKAQLLQKKSLEVKEQDKIYWQKLALQTYLTAIDFAEYLRRSYDQSGSKLYFAQKVFPIYEDAIEQAYLLAEQSHDASYQAMIYRIFQVTKSTVLSDITHDSFIKPKTIPKRLLEDEKELQKELHRLELAGANTENQSVTIDLQHQEYRQLKKYYNKRFEQKNSTLDYTQSNVLDYETAILDYFWGKEHLYVFVVTKTETKLIRQAWSEGFKGSIKDLKHELYFAPPEGYKYKGSNAAKTLYDWLIRPVAPLVEDKKRLIFIRDGDLQYIPFNILEKPNNDPNHFYKYCLFQDHVISYDYSLASISNRTNFDKKKWNTLVFAPYSSLYKIGLNSGLRDSTLGPLPSSGQEAQAIGGQLFINGLANKATFIKVLNEADVIYLLTHAKADTNGKGAIAFYQDGKEFRLFTPEFYDLDLSRTQLVVLSACETSIGESHPGEGMMSVARGIAYAGCISTVMTHWNASDNRTPQITTRFNELLHSGLSFAEALQQSQIDYLEKGNAEQHPYYWANMALIGQDQILNNNTNYWLWALGILAALLLGFFGYRFLKKVR